MNDHEIIEPTGIPGVIFCPEVVCERHGETYREHLFPGCRACFFEWLREERASQGLR